jgi:hypothetical protein
MQIIYTNKILLPDSIKKDTGSIPVLVQILQKQKGSTLERG